MNAGKQAAWIFSVLIGLAFSGWYFAASEELIEIDEKSLTHTVDTIINDLHVKEYNDKGLLINSLTSPLVKHTPFEDKHWFKKPVIRVTQNDEEPWLINAMEATSYNSGDKIILNHDVVIHQTSSNHQNSTITTNQLIYFPNKKIAISEEHVMFKQPGTTVQSNGMKAWLAEKRVKLLGKARGQYDPKQG